MQVSFQDGIFVCRCKFDERHIPKQKGFRWNPDKKQWYTPSYGIAARLREYADGQAKKELRNVLLEYSPWTGAIPIPKGKTPFPFQFEAATFSLSRNRSYLGLDPGLGKTIVAALIARALGKAVVYVCPPFLVKNVQIEFEKWEVKLPLLIIPDSILHANKMKEKLGFFLNEIPDAILFVDEAHRFKTAGSLRTKTLLSQIVVFFERIIFMSGTPMPNRPLELFPILNRCAPETISFMDQFTYAKEYCDAHQTPWGWDFTGASNMQVLAKRVLGTFMLRMKKEQVLKDLPPKLEELLFVGEDVPPTIAAIEHRILEAFSPSDLMGYLAPNGHVATYRKELGIAKAEYAVSYLETLLSETDESILVFAIHKDVIERLATDLDSWNPLVITGATPMDKRQRIVEEFQTNKERRLFIGNIQAAGTGFTLTKATRVVFAEFSWVPADNDQASDRAHRIGQKDSVYVQYLVFQNSIDRAVMETILAKRKITAHV